MANLDIEQLFRDLYVPLYKHLYSLSARRGHSTLNDVIEDCIQSTFLTLYEKRNSLVDHPNISGWLYITATNKLMNHKKKSMMEASHCKVSFDDGFHELYAEPSNDSSFADQTLEQIEDLLGEKAFQFMLAYYNKDKTIKQVAQDLNTTEGALKMRAKRQIVRLKKRLKIYILLTLLFVCFKK